MYDRDMPLVRAHAEASPAGLADVITFVLLTIQQPFHMVGRQMQDVRLRGAASSYLFASKRAGYGYATENAASLYAGAFPLRDAGDKVGLIRHFLQVPGLGIVKAAFVGQCIGGETACLDTHNLNRLGLPPGAFKLPANLKPDALNRKLDAYVETCERVGSSEWWWNEWCAFVAGRRKSPPLATADAVSAAHPAALLAA